MTGRFIDVTKNEELENEKTEKKETKNESSNFLKFNP